jgi:hypothetical protein
MADITPIVKGACGHKGDTGSEATCAVDEGCGPAYNAKYGEPLAFQSGTGFVRDAVERASFTLGFVLVMATNSEAEWAGGKYRASGPMTVCVSYPFLDHWRCQDGNMSDEGLLEGVGANVFGYDLLKSKGEKLDGVDARSAAR